VKHSHIYIAENGDSEEEDKSEKGNEDMTSDVTPDVTSDSSTRGTSTTSNSRPSCSKQSKRFNMVWLKGRKHWLKYEKGVGCFAYFARNMISVHMIKMFGIKNHVQGLDCRVFLTMKKAR